jgi:hypothetical protein
VSTETQALAADGISNVGRWRAVLLAVSVYLVFTNAKRLCQMYTKNSKYVTLIVKTAWYFV